MSETIPLRRSIALNYFLGGALTSLLTVNACSAVGGDATPLEAAAHAEDGPVEVIIVGHDFNATSPMPVMVCDGQEESGLCAQVFASGLDGRHLLYTP